jgi:hypothetical protein
MIVNNLIYFILVKDKGNFITTFIQKKVKDWENKKTLKNGLSRNKYYSLSSTTCILV